MRDAHRAGRLLVLGYEGLAPPRELFDFARRFGLGGIILFRRNCGSAEAVRRATDALRQGLREADPGGCPLVLVDQEGGRVERLREGVPRLPPARELGVGGEDGVFDAVQGQAEALARLGIDVNLAPVCDVLQEGESGAIGDRSFGEDPHRVAILAAAHVRASLAGGVIPCAKHFPGHGAARLDSHEALPVVDKGWEELEGFDLVPFHAAIAAGAPLVMAAHLVVPAVSDRPASLSQEWLDGRLRGRLGFRGAVISDDLEMGALAAMGTPGEVAVEAVRSGCDLLILGRMLRPGLDPVRVAESLATEVAASRLEEALERTGRVGKGP